MFDYIPISCIIDNEVIAVHGGLSPSLETIDEMSRLNRY